MINSIKFHANWLRLLNILQSNYIIILYIDNYIWNSSNCSIFIAIIILSMTSLFFVFSGALIYANLTNYATWKVCQSRIWSLQTLLCETSESLIFYLDFRLLYCLYLFLSFFNENRACKECWNYWYSKIAELKENKGRKTRID